MYFTRKWLNVKLIKITGIIADSYVDLAQDIFVLFQGAVGEYRK